MRAEKKIRRQKRLPVVGYDSVSVPSGLYCRVKLVVGRRKDLGYRSVTEFVAEAIRAKLIALGETRPEVNKS